MAKVTVIDRMREFASKNEAAMDAALAEMATDIIRMARPLTPYFQGRLRASARFERVKRLSYKVGYYTEYAAYQEFGQRRDGSHIVRRHTTGGTKTHYLSDSGRQVTKNAPAYVRKHADRLARSFRSGV